MTGQDNIMDGNSLFFRRRFISSQRGSRFTTPSKVKERRTDAIPTRSQRDPQNSVSFILLFTVKEIPIQPSCQFFWCLTPVLVAVSYSGREVISCTFSSGRSLCSFSIDESRKIFGGRKSSCWSPDNNPLQET
jgi:hypothetical protein